MPSGRQGRSLNGPSTTVFVCKATESIAEMEADDSIVIGTCADENHHKHNKRQELGCRPPVGFPWLDMTLLRDAEVAENAESVE